MGEKRVGKTGKTGRKKGTHATAWQKNNACGGHTDLPHSAGDLQNDV